MIPWLYHITQLFVQVFFRVVFFTRVDGGDRFPVEGPLIVAGNHTSFWDPMLLAAIAPRPIAFMARRTLFDVPLFGRYITALNAFPLDRDGDPRDALRRFGERLEAREAIVIFPEGRRSDGGRLQPLREGAALLAARHGATIIPVYMAGPFRSWPRGRRLPRWCRFRVYVGEPIVPAEAEGASVGRKELARRLEASLHELESRALGGGPG